MVEADSLVASEGVGLPSALKHLLTFCSNMLVESSLGSESILTFVVDLDSASDIAASCSAGRMDSGSSLCGWESDPTPAT